MKNWEEVKQNIEKYGLKGTPRKKPILIISGISIFKNGYIKKDGFLINPHQFTNIKPIKWEQNET